MYQDQEQANEQALANPQVGDYWHEMFCPYFIIVNVEGDQYRVLSCMGGPNSVTRKHEIYAKKDLGAEGWCFDYSKSMLVDRAWIEKAVKYDSIDGFVADVVQSAKTETIVQEWRTWKQKELRKQIQSLESEWETFTGWRYLKEEINE